MQTYRYRYHGQILSQPVINTQLDRIASKSSIIFAVNLNGFSVNDSLGEGVTSNNADT